MGIDPHFVGDRIAAERKKYLDEIITYKGSLSGPRWLRIQKCVRDGAMMYDLDVIEMIQDRGWLREDIWYTLRGRREDVHAFEEALEITVKEYQDARAGRKNRR